MTTSADFAAAGLYDPTAPGAADRLALLEWLVARGVTLEQMIESQRRGSPLTGLAGDLAMRSGDRLTLAEFAAQTGLPAERIERIRLAAGLPPLDPADPAFSPDDADIYRASAIGEALLGDAAMLHFVRVLGSSLARVAEAAVALFLANLEAPIVERHGGELALAKANLEAIQALEMVPRFAGVIFRAHMETAIRRLRAAREDWCRANTVRLTVGFVDLVGYTRLSRQMDVRALGTVVERFEAFASDLVTAHDGRLVKLIGDEVMFVAVDGAAACEIALTLVERFVGDASVTPRGGLAAGELLIRGGDYYGPVVNLASRICELAVPHEILVTPEVVEQAGRSRFHFEPAGRRMLKGFDVPVALYAAARPSPARPDQRAP